MRKALIVGVNYYENINSLSGCVPDAYSMNSVLSDNSDGTKNFDTKLITAFDSNSALSRSDLKGMVRELFQDDNSISLFYFSGHGYIENTGGYLITSDCSDGDDGLSMTELLKIVNDSNVKNKIIILDTCHAGAMGNIATDSNIAIINEGVTILTASQKTEYSIDEGDGSLFTKLLVDALNGTASNLLGDVSPGSVYAHVDQSLGAWEQRPVFKTNVKNFVSLRKTQPPISLTELKKITELFDINFEHDLDPSYEPESENPLKENVEKFAVLQKYNRINLVVPVNAPHMYHAAMESKSCKLTVLGEFYWKLVSDKRI
ncbi:caspase family protein [Listeria seeligeri]|uniref:caspase family protein n=1 Tax=Listeria seeligeri TaxID=1640 RepID=UPI0022EBF694|nr:caspase family protein [Listeria seeligeri]